MTELLLLIIAVLLAFIAVKVAGIAARQVALNRWVSSALSPKEYSFIDELAGKDNPPRTIIDQVGAVVAELDRRVAQLDDKLAYFRSYLWEVQDPRHIDDIRRPPESSQWKMKFKPMEDTSRYGLWMRERDMDESFHRDVVLPTLRRNGGDQQPADSHSEASEDEDDQD